MRLALISDVHALVTAIGEPVHLVGHDWGAAVAWSVAQRFPEHVWKLAALQVPPGAAWAHITRLAETAGLPWVVEPHGAASRHFAEQACRQAGFEPDVRFETADLTAQIELIETGNAVALIPDLMWARRPPLVRLVDLDGVPHRTVFTAARRSMAQRPSILACREALTAAVEHAPRPHPR